MNLKTEEKTIHWKPPRDEHIVYEALSAIADKRVEIVNEEEMRVTSTSKNKYYTVEFLKEENLITSNDNMAYYVGEVSYPMVVAILVNNMIKYEQSILEHLKGIKWKDINQKNKNDYMKSVGEVLEGLRGKGVETEIIENEVQIIFRQILKMKLGKSAPLEKPPSAY